MEIQSNHNLALMLNGVHYNIANIINGLVYEIIKTSRLDLIRIHFASVLLILILMILVVHWLFPSRHAICNFCVRIIKAEDDGRLYCRNRHQAVTCVLNSLQTFMGISKTVCQDAIEAGIVPLLRSTLSKTSYLDNLDANEPIMFLFQASTRILFHILQIDELKMFLNHYHYEILLGVLCRTKNSILRLLIFLTIARIARDRMIKFPLTIDDVSIFFQVYYESSKSKDKTAYGIKFEELCDGFRIIGQLESQYKTAHR
ncbi:unnamed protein product [Rotaria magnacalcarata]|uniref:Uncharacterized protein n=1 Tax=Rotaria magnacalcarata TaxID=392030 RepID=A0A8S2QLK6_9BILA|nr:unnamed protein product [Rotaria magnacalcarata]CAF4404405.1 unnamed protein product [Rotaria magnacalcarata]CAF4603592.1 unnamed protein product [Rotaria magnacalcarata]